MADETSDFERNRAWREQDHARFLKESEISAERANVLTQTRAQILNEGSKGLILINVGGAAALAAFLQAIWNNPDIEPMRWWILFGMCWLIAGTAVSASIFVTRYLGAFHPKTTTPTQNPWWWFQLNNGAEIGTS